jgi:hypothetical protein
MNLFLKNSAGFAFERFDGKLALARTDLDGTIAYEIADTDILLKSNKPAVKVSYTNIDDTITGIVIKYQKVLADEDYYAQTSYCYRMNAIGTLHNWTLLDTNGNWQYYSGLLEQAYATRESENILTIEADGIRDAATAERLARAIVLQRWQSMAMLDIDCAYTMLKAEIGDQVSTDIAIVDPLGLNAKTWLIVRTRIIPTIGGNPSVGLRLLEIGATSVPDDEEWQDTYSTGEIKQNTYSTGALSVGVY